MHVFKHPEVNLKNINLFDAGPSMLGVNLLIPRHIHIVRAHIQVQLIKPVDFLSTVISKYEST